MHACVCGEDLATTYLEGRFRRLAGNGYPFKILVCVSCGLARTSPTPTPQQYADSHAHSSTRLADGDTYSAGLAAVAAEISPGGRLLDVGCSTGEVIEHAWRLGMDAVGVDQDPRPVAAGLAAGRQLVVAELEDLVGSYDVILMNHTLEHIHDPVAFLSAAAGLLAPRGSLLVNVPNYHSPVARLMRDQWVGWLPAEHVFHYATMTLSATAHRAGLRLTECSSRGVIEPPSRGVKGAVKRAVIAAAGASGHGDEIACVFRR